MEFKETSAYLIFLKQLGEVRPKIEALDATTMQQKELRLFLHALKGNAGLFGFSELGLLAKELSEISDAQDARFELTKRALLLSIDKILEMEKVPSPKP